jgi:hypothetical protein
MIEGAVPCGVFNPTVIQSFNPSYTAKVVFQVKYRWAKIGSFAKGIPCYIKNNLSRFSA